MGFIQKCVLVVVIGLSVMCVGPASAENVKAAMSWTPTLLFEDGSKMSSSEIADYEVHYTIDKAFTEMKNPIRVGLSITDTFALPLELKPRAKEYIVRMGVKTVSIYGAKSKMSNVIEQKFQVANTKRPQPPINIKLELQCSPECKIISQEVVGGNK